MRPGSSVSSAPPTRTASAFIPISCIPSRSSRIPGIVSASTRLPASTREATPPVVWSSSSSSAKPIVRSSSASSRRDIVVEFVTKRRRWPSSRRRRTASTAPGIGSPETCSTPSTSSRIAAMDVESIRSEVAFRVSRSSGPGGQHAQKSSTRVEALFDVEGSDGALGGRAEARARAPRARRPRRRPGRALSGPEPRARDRAGSSSRSPRRRSRGASAGRPSPPPASREQRLEEKKRRGGVKRLRQPPDPD